MANITLAIDAETVKKVRKLALERDTTLSAMVRDYLRSVAAEQSARHMQEVAALRDRITRHRVCSGGVRWTRDELHDRI
jgi:hypothetical protein